MDDTTLSLEAISGLKEKDIHQVVAVPCKDLLAFTCIHDRRIKVFDNNAWDEPVVVFEKHVSQNSASRTTYVLHLIADILCSMVRGGNIITWVAGTGEVLETFQVSGSAGIWKLNDTNIGVLLCSGAVLILEHSKGKAMKQVREIPPLVSKACSFHCDESVQASVAKGDDTARIRNYLTSTEISYVQVGKGFDSVRAGDNFIAFAARHEGILRIHEKVAIIPSSVLST